MRTALGAALALLILASCANEKGSDVQGSQPQECTPRIRLADKVYVAAGYTDTRGQRFSTAQQATCEDTSSDSRGSVFAEDPEEVAVWSLPGYDTVDVLATRFGGNSFEVYVSDSMPRQEIDRIVRRLSDEPGDRASG